MSKVYGALNIEDSSTETLLFLDSNGFVGIGSTPNSNWGVQADNRYVLDMGATCLTGGEFEDDYATFLGFNFYLNAAGTTRYKSTGAISYVRMAQTGMSFRIATSGTANGDATSNLTNALNIDVDSNVAVGEAALATTATDGFLYIPTCAGAPTGTPTAKTGLVPIIFDTTNDTLNVYDGGWVSVSLT